MISLFIVRGRSADGTMYWSGAALDSEWWSSSPYEAKPMMAEQAEQEFERLRSRPVKDDPDEHVYVKGVDSWKPQPGPYNEQAHAHLIELGYVRTWHEDSFEDGGDAENGPDLTGGPAFDEYKSADDYVMIDEQGHFAHYERRDPEIEEWAAGMGAGR
jgi:hypothetical protein